MDVNLGNWSLGQMLTPVPYLGQSIFMAAVLWQFLVRPLIHCMNKLWNVTEAHFALGKDVELLSLPFTHWWAGWTACLNVMDVILMYHTWKLMNSFRASCRDYKDTPWIKYTIEILATGWILRPQFLLNLLPPVSYKNLLFPQQPKQEDKDSESPWYLVCIQWKLTWHWSFCRWILE